MTMTFTAPQLDWLHLKMEDVDHVTSMPLCEVIEGQYSREQDNHIISNNGNTAAMASAKFSAFLDIQFAYVGRIEYWMIQMAGDEPSEQLQQFIKKFNK